MTAVSGSNGRLHTVPDIGLPAAEQNGGSARLEVVDARALPYRYDVHGLLSIGSEIALRELAYFRVPPRLGGMDIEVRRGRVGLRRPRRSVRIQRGAGRVSYHEHLGGLGANFDIVLGTPIRVTVGPLLARSPHVVYTNVVEALLRFVLASRDMILLHGATMTLHGTGVMLSAETDTGKTTTVLRMLRDHGGVFLSDDMTIVDATGRALCYPKPLTISAHTLQAVETAELRLKQRLRLAVQSRIHSRSGRSIGQRLGDMNIPIMAVNALTQMVVPPPKYHVGELVPCTQGETTDLRRLFVIERGAARHEPIDRAEAVDLLLANTNDAYGFPPFRYFAPAITLGDEGYEQLCLRERNVLRSALQKVRIERLARDDFSWSDAIPALVAQSRDGALVGPVEGAV
jgi:dolichol-phosphate mannosyltransferase